MSKLNNIKKHTSVVVTCPTRIDFTGGFTDVLPFRGIKWVSHVNLAINLHMRVSIKFRNDNLIEIKTGGNLPAIFTLLENIDPKFLLIKKALEISGVNRGVTITIDSRAPTGAGLGTSGSLSVALTIALRIFTGKDLPDNKFELAMLGYKLEESCGSIGGLQDQFAAAKGELNLFQFYNSEYKNTKIDLSADFINEMQNHVMILNPGGSRVSSDIVGDIMNSLNDENSLVKKTLLALDDLAGSIVDSLKEVRWADLSSLLLEVQKKQLQLHPNIIDSRNLTIINDLKQMGVKGVKLLGGGGASTCMLVVVEDAALRTKVQNYCTTNLVEILPVNCNSTGLEVSLV